MKILKRKLADGLWLHSVAVDVPMADAWVPETTNHVLIFDRSGSMQGSLKQLIGDLKKWVRFITQGDWVSIGYFSGEGGQYEFIVRGMEVTPNSYHAIDRILDSHDYTLTTTCFSEVLTDSLKVMQDMGKLSGSNSYNFVFFTDGYPVVRNVQLETKNTLRALEQVKDLVTSALLVGYGDYYNKGLMAQMAQVVGGQLVHANKLGIFREQLEAVTTASVTSERVAIRLPKFDGAVYAVFSVSDNDNVIMYQPDDNNTVRWEANADGCLLIVTEKPLRETPPDISERLRWSYAAALVLSQLARTDLALEILSAIGDVGLIEQLQAAFTNAEYGQAESNIGKAIGIPYARFTKGRQTGYLPNRNAFCLLDLFAILDNDPDVRFYPRHEAFSYKRIGVKHEQVDSELKFAIAPATSVSFSTVWHKSRLNLSVSCSIPGTVTLKDESQAKSLGLPAVVHTNVFRTYTIVKDGLLNVDTLPLSMSSETFDKLDGLGLLLPGSKWRPGAVYPIKLDTIPVINRAIAEDYLSATQLLKSFYQSLVLGTEINVLKKIRDGYFPKTEADKTAKLAAVYSQEAVDYLKAHGITDSGFRPETSKGQPSDWYIAQTIEIKAGGLSTIPTIEAVEKVMQAGKKLTPAQQLVAKSLTIVDKAATDQMPDALKKALLDNEIRVRQNQLKGHREYIQRAKFAVILGKRWFSEFASRQENVLIVDGTEYTIELGQEEVGY